MTTTMADTPTPAPAALVNFRAHYVETVDDAAEMMRWLSADAGRSVLGYDTETSGLGWNDTVRLYQFGDASGTAYALRADRWSGVAEQVLRTYSGRIAAHNLKFDHRMTDNALGIGTLPIRQCDDTMLMARIVDTAPLDSASPAGLKALAARLIDRRAADSQRLLDNAMNEQGWTWATVPVDFPFYWAYGCMDPVITALLYDHYASLVPRAAYELELAASRITGEMERRGAQIDVSYAEATVQRMTAYTDQARQWCTDAYGISISANQQIAETLEAEGFQLPRTPKGQIATTRAVLEQINHPLAGAVLKYRGASKVVSTYVGKFLSLCDGDGRIHADIRVMGAKTSRMSIAKPSLQNLPARASHGSIVRDAFIPYTPDECLLTVDYDQIEARLAAHYSRDPGLIAAFDAPEDFFTVIMRQVYGDPALTKEDSRRSLIKNMTYGRIYGAGVEKMADTAGVTADVMRPVNDMFDQLYPGLARLSAQVIKVGRQRAQTEGQPYVVTPQGRRLYAESDKPYKLVNYLIQATAAEILKTALVECEAADVTQYLVLPVHDELIFSVPKDQVSDVEHTVIQCMQNTTDYAVPLTVESSGPIDRWGAKYSTGAEDGFALWGVDE